MTPFVELDGAVAVVTGAGSGIGKATSVALGRRGTRVVVTDLDGNRASETAGEITSGGGQAMPLACDVGSLDDLERTREAALDAFGQVDVVMNNVGVIAVGAPESLPLREWERTIDLNLFGIVRSNFVFLPLLLAQGRGHIVNTASAAGLLPYGYDRLAYTTTKHAVVGLSESLALYLRPRGVGVTCLCPAGVRTNIVEQITFYDRSSTPRAPAFPVVEPSEVAELVVQAIEDDRFLVLSVPEVGDELARRARDIDAYVRAESETP